jgi:hypothetical protein
MIPNYNTCEFGLKPFGIFCDAQNSTKEVLSFMASHGSQGFTIAKLLMMKRICDKLISIGIAHLTSTKQCDIRSFLLPSLRPFIDLIEALE